MSSTSDGHATPMDRARWICPILDRACAELLEWEQAGIHPSELRFHPDVHARLAELRRRELDAGVPLLVLGTDVVPDPTLEPHEFTVIP